MPVVPVLAAVGGGSALAGGLTLAATGAGIYNALEGADASRRAVNIAQDQANAATNAVSGSGASNDTAILAYFNSDPAFLAEYNRNRAATGDNRTQVQWLRDGLAQNPAQMQEFLKFQTQSGVIPSSAMGPGGTVDVNILQQQAQAVANQNAAAAAELERQYNPGAQELRAGSLEALLQQLNRPASAPVGTLAAVPEIAEMAPIEAVTYDSPLTRAAIAQAQADLALGGLLPQDVRNLVARNALARSGAVTGGLSLGRDITARDLGLTSLQLQQQRLQNALQAGGAEAGLEGANATIRNQVAAQNRAAELQRQGLIQQRAAQEASNYFNENNLMQNLASGDFARTLAAAQLGQNIQQPQAGLSPGSVADVAIGNVNLANNAQQQANAIRAQSGQEQSKLGAGLIGGALTSLSDAFKPKPYTFPTTSYSSSMAPVFCWVAREVYGPENIEWVGFRDWLLLEGPEDFRKFYFENGKDIAEQIKDNPKLKTLIRYLMTAAKA